MRALEDSVRMRGKVVLVTGGSQGIGFSTAKLFLEEGASVVITGRSTSKGIEAVRQLKTRGRVEFIQGDVSNPVDAKRMVDGTIGKFGRLDILFNNAGIYIPGLAEDMAIEDWDKVIDINLKGAFLVSKFAIPHMRRQGSGVIINNSSEAGIVGETECPAHCASKGGVIALTKAMALDYAREGIRVNCVAPGTIGTTMLERVAQDSRDPASYLEHERSSIPLGRIGHPQEVARTVLFLASDAATFVTGAVLSIDGGVTAE